MRVFEVAALIVATLSVVFAVIDLTRSALARRYNRRHGLRDL